MLKRFGVGFFVSLLFVVIGLVVLGVIFKSRTVPVLSGSAEVRGISDAVQIERDTYGVPNIYAKTDADAYYGLGYAEAQDRLFQMEMERRVGEGRLCELVGKKALVLDIWAHTIGFRRIAHQLWLRASPQTQRFVTSYVHGINAYIAEHKARLGFEFDALQFTPEPWDPEESMMIGRLMSWELNFAYWTDAAFSDIALSLDSAHLLALYPHYPETGSTALEGASPQVIAARWTGAEPVIVRNTTKKDTAKTQIKTKQNAVPTAHNNFAAAPHITPKPKPKVKPKPKAKPGQTSSPAQSTTPKPKPKPAKPLPARHVPVPGVPSGALEKSGLGDFYADLRQVNSLLREYLGPLTAGGGSNSFVLGPSRTTTGGAILENDTHLRLGSPARWYLAHLQSAEGLNVAGFGIPGLPIIIAGRNEKVSWGITSGMADEADFFTETTDSTGKYYQSPSGMQPFVEITDSVRIRDSIKTNPSLTLGVYIRQTVHGPVISDHPFLMTQAYVGNPRSVTIPKDTSLFNPKRIISMTWNGEFVDGDEVGAFFALHRSQNVTEAKSVLRTFATPILNMCLADNTGAIAYEYIGRIPKRSGSEDRLMLPRDGADPAQQWQGFMNAADIAAVTNPPRGYVVSANDPPTRNRQLPISDVWETSARADRIAQLIEQTGRIDTGRATKILTDVTSPFDRDILLPLLLAQYPDPDPVSFQADSTWQYRFDSIKHLWKWDSLEHHTSLNDSVVRSMVIADSLSMHRTAHDSTAPHYSDPILAHALNYLRNWDGAMRASETAPTIYAVFLQTLMKNTFRDELGPDRYSEFSYLSSIILNSLERLLSDPQNIWWDDVNTPNIVEDRDSIIKLSFSETLHILKMTFGNDMKLWQWGRLHTLTYHHQFEAAGSAMAKLVNIETGPASGGLTTVSQAAYNMWNPYEMRVGPSMRMLADMKTETLLASLPTGNSEAVFGTHYRDMVQLFKAGGFDPVSLDKRDPNWIRFELLPAN